MNFVIIQNSQSTGVILGQAHSSASLRYAGWIDSCEEHDTRLAFDWRFQGEVEHLPHRLQDMEDRTHGKCGIRVTKSTSCLRALFRYDILKPGNVLRGDIHSSHIPQNRQNMVIKKLAGKMSALSVALCPFPILLRQVAECQLSGLYQRTAELFLLALLTSHFSFLSKRLGSHSQSNVLLQLTQQTHGLGNGPALRGPTERLMMALAVTSSISYGKTSIRDAAIAPCRMFPVHHSFFAGNRLPLDCLTLACVLLFFVTHLSPTPLDLKGISRLSFTQAGIKMQINQHRKSYQGFFSCVLLSSRPRVRLTPGTP